MTKKNIKSIKNMEINEYIALCSAVTKYVDTFCKNLDSHRRGRLGGYLLTIAFLAATFNVSHTSMLQICEDIDNTTGGVIINVGWGCNAGISRHRTIGEYTLENG